jgi:hypothetical protein
MTPLTQASGIAISFPDNLILQKDWLNSLKIKTMKNVLTHSLFLFALFLAGCNEAKAPEERVYIQTLEVVSGDTCNRVDSKGRKQGKWVPTAFNNERDTVWYRNDSIL